MEVIEDGNIMDRIPILLQRDLEYYQKNQTILSETVCHGVVGGRLDFPRNASFAAVKIVLWLEDEFSIAFEHGSGMFVVLEEDKVEGGIAKTSDPDKFVQSTIKSTDMLMEHLHMLVQEALDHADLPVLTSALGAAALIKNTLHCYLQHLDDSGSAERHSLLQSCYKGYVTMSEAVAERVLDLHTRVLSLYILQDSGGRPIDDHSCRVQEAGSPSVQGWWLYMQGSRQDLWDTVPPRMAQRIFAGMLNETLTILNVRYCQTVTTETTTKLLVNDILNILLCTAQLLPSICTNGSDLAGFDVKLQSRDVRDVHAKCNELFKCMVYRGAELHYIHQTFIDQETSSTTDLQEHPSPWFTFVSPHLFEEFDDRSLHCIRDLPPKAIITAAFIDQETSSTTDLQEHPSPWFTFVSPHLFEEFDDRSLHCIRDLPPKAIITAAFIDQETSTTDLQEHPSPWFTFVSPHLFEEFDDRSVHSIRDLPPKAFITAALIDQETPSTTDLQEHPSPWFTFVSPHLFEEFDDRSLHGIRDLPPKPAIALELLVLLAQPQPSWTLLVKVLMMRDCYLSRSLLIHATRNMSVDNLKWPASGQWYSLDGKQPSKCTGFLCTADRYCKSDNNKNVGFEYSKVAGALTYILATIGSKAELKSTLVYALEISGRDWASCLDKRQVWCDRRPSWLAGILGLVGTALQFLPPILVNAIQTGASMYQTMSLCLTCLSRTLDVLPRSFLNASTVLGRALPSHVHPVGGSLLLQLLVTVAYEEILLWAHREACKEKAVAPTMNGQPAANTVTNRKQKHVRISLGDQTTSSSMQSSDGSSSQPSWIALAIAESLCSLDEDHKHAQEIEALVAESNKEFKLSSQFGLEDFPEFAEFLEEGVVAGSNAERPHDASALTTQLLMTAAGRDSLRVVWEHVRSNAARVCTELGGPPPPTRAATTTATASATAPATATAPARMPVPASLLYVMFHIGQCSFDQFLREEWPMPWTRLVAAAKLCSGVDGARVHVTKRHDMRAHKHVKTNDKMLIALTEIFKSNNNNAF